MSGDDIGAADVDGDGELRGLAWWRGPGQDLGTGVARVMAAPELPAAVRTLAQSTVDLVAEHRLLDGVLKDAGRYVATMLVFYLHERGELTLPRLKALAVQSGFLSPGRARALLHFLEHLGCVEPEQRSGGAVRYRLTDPFVAVWTGQLHTALKAALLLEPAAAELLAADLPAMRTFAALHAASLLHLASGGAGRPSTFVMLFLHPYAGPQIMASLMVEAEGGEFPPRRAGPISHSALSRRFGVSRIHVKRIFDRAAQEGVIRLDSDGMVHFGDEAREYLRFHYAMQFQQMLATAATAATMSEVHGL